MPRPNRASALFSVVALISLIGGCGSAPQTALSGSAPSPSVSQPSTAPSEQGLGVLVMAHGGGEEWNQNVSASVSELGERIPLAVAFGMADPNTLQAAVDELENQGVSTIAVVRLFLSGASFLHQTEFLFGMRPYPPRMGMIGHGMVEGSDLPLLKTNARVLLDRAGMAGSEQVSRIMVSRAEASASDPAKTGVVLIAHGMGAEEENQRVLDAMENSVQRLRSNGYGEVQVATLREDWAEAREHAERQIRATVSRMGEQWEEVVVIPYRVFGFGPYADVLEGLEYVATDGLLPHSLVGDWVAIRSSAVLCAADLAPVLGPCPAVF